MKTLNVDSILWKLTLSSKRRILSKTLSLLPSMLLCQHLHVSLPISMTGFFTYKWMFLSLENNGRYGVFLKAKSVLKGIQCVRLQSSHFDCIFPGDTFISSIQPYGSVSWKMNGSSKWKYWQIGSILLKFKHSAQRATFSNRLMLLTSKLWF
jgi:hypothetical protein